MIIVVIVHILKSVGDRKENVYVITGIKNKIKSRI